MSSFGHAERARREHVEFRRIIRAHDVGGVAKLLLLGRIVIIAAGDLRHIRPHEIGGGVLTDHIRIDPGSWAILRTSAGRTMPPPRGVSMLPCMLLDSTNPPTASFSIRPAAC